MKKQICILGSTGSIGTQALDVIRQHPDLYEVYCLTANNSGEAGGSRLAVSPRRRGHRQ
jgi:1-deoxy-D-xylulose-5-phosphate reductoisomerase